MPNPPSEGRSFPSKLIWLKLQVKYFLTDAAFSDLANAVCRRAVDFERERWWMSFSKNMKQFDFSQGLMSLLDPFNSIKTDFTSQTLKIVNFGMKGCV